MAKITNPILQPKEEYLSEKLNPKILYGLPSEITFCSNCCFSNQKPNSELEYKHNFKTKKPTVQLDENQVCSACKISEKKKLINWAEREKMLKDLCDKYRRKDGKYDCLVPGSGGKDSFYAAHKLKYEYNMNPLTVTWAPVLYTDWGWKNFQSWIQCGFDNYLFNANGKIQRLLCRLALENLFHPFQPFIMGQMYFPPKIANMLNIPLVFYGENPTEYGNNSNEDNSATKNSNYFSYKKDDEIFISGMNILELKDEFKLTENDLAPYLPIDANQITNKKIDVQYLGYYIPWHPQECYYYAVEHGGFQSSPERTIGTYSKYSSIDDKIDDLHYYTTYVKFGIGRATYDASQEIRSGDITREEGISLIKRFDGEFPKRFIPELFNYLSISKTDFPKIFNKFQTPLMDMDYFNKLTDSFRSPHIWKIDEGNWKLRSTVY